MVTARDGASQLCAVKGTEVSMVREASEEIGRDETAADKGFARVDPRPRREKVERAIGSVANKICCDFLLLVFE